MRATKVGRLRFPNVSTFILAKCTHELHVLAAAGMIRRKKGCIKQGSSGAGADCPLYASEAQQPAPPGTAKVSPTVPARIGQRKHGQDIRYPSAEILPAWA